MPENAASLTPEQEQMLLHLLKLQTTAGGRVPASDVRSDRFKQEYPKLNKIFEQLKKQGLIQHGRDGKCNLTNHGRTLATVLHRANVLDGEHGS